MKCEHEYNGDANGIFCKKCGERITLEAYLAWLNSKNEKPKGKKVKKDE